MLNATLVDRIDVTPDLARLFVKPDAPHAPFHPGQYVALGLPGRAPRPARFPNEIEVPDPDKIIKRAYSIGSSPSEPSVLEFYIALLPSGALTSRLAALKSGDRLFTAPKITGTFTLDSVPEDANLVLVSTGTGIAPYLSMIRTPGTWKPNRLITILHGVRYESDLGYRDELESLRSRTPDFRYHSIVSRPSSSWGGNKGYVQNFFNDGTVALNPGRDHVFLCGNPAMIDDVEKLLAVRGYRVHSKKEPGNLHLERYW